MLRNAEWESELRAAHEITLGKLPKGVREVLALPERARVKLIAERRKLLEKKTEAKAAEKVAAKKKPGKRGA